LLSPSLLLGEINSEEATKIRLSTWRAMEKLYADGKCRALGVSNYLSHHLEEIFHRPKPPSNEEYDFVIPAVNQIEFHPKLFQHELLQFCQQYSIQVVSYASLGRGKMKAEKTLLDHPIVKTLANTYNKTPGQILLRWALQHKTAVIPKSEHQDRIIENTLIFDFEIQSEHMETLNQMHCGHHYCWNPETIF